MSELAGRLVVIKVSGDPLDLSEEALTQGTTYEWQITDANKRVIDPDVDPTLEYSADGGTTWNDQNYTSVNKLNGMFVLGDNRTDDLVRVKTTVTTANYLPMSEAASAHNYNYDRGVDLLDVTAFRQEDPDNPGEYIPSTHKKRIPGQKFASGSINKWDVVDSYFRDALTDGSPVVLEFRAEDTGDPQRLWALLESAEMSAAIDSPQDEAVSFISTDELLNIS